MQKMRDEETDRKRVYEIYTELRHQIWYVSACLVGEIEAEDVVHEVMMELMTRIESLDGRSKMEIRAFVLKIATNRCKDILRSCEWKTLSLDALREKGMEWPSEQDEPEEIVLTEELMATLGQSLTRLEPEYRIPLEFRLNRIGTREIAEQMRLTTYTVDKRISRGRKELKRMLAEADYYV